MRGVTIVVAVDAVRSSGGHERYEDAAAAVVELSEVVAGAEEEEGCGGGGWDADAEAEAVVDTMVVLVVVVVVVDEYIDAR